MSRRRARGEPHSAMDGSLCDHAVRKLLELCQRHRLTGVLHITSWGRSGRVEIRAGQITTAAFGALQGHAATTELLGLRDGLFELHQHLPSVEAAGQRGRGLPLSAVTEQCRTRALSCRVEVVSRKQRAVITYRAGELESLEVDGGPLPEGMDAGQVLAPFESGQVHVEALPLSLHEPASPEAVAAQAPQEPQASAQPVPRPAGREDSRPARVPPPVPLAARQDSRPNRVHAAPPPVPLAARQDSRPNHAPAAPAGAKLVRRPKAASVVNPTLQPVPLQPSSAATSVPVALGHPQTDGSGAVSGVQPWFDDPGPSGAIPSLRNALASRRELAVPALVTLVLVSLLLIIGFVALQP